VYQMPYKGWPLKYVGQMGCMLESDIMSTLETDKQMAKVRNSPVHSRYDA
jgi:hypothetical protein